MLRHLTATCLLLALAGQSAAAAPRVSVDETALRYYASLGQQSRVAAEARRLQRLDPAWHVPDDLYATKPGRADEEPLWDLYAQGRLAEIARAVALRQAAEPGWTPSEDLTAKVRAKALRARIVSLATAGDWRAVLRSLSPMGLTWAKDDAEALWIIAEAYAREKDCAEAYVVYRLILAGHSEPAERRATVEHAIALIPMALTEKLVAMGRKDAAGRNEFEAISIDLTRARISAFLHDEPANEVTGDALSTFEDAARAGNDPNELGLVAWYAYKRRDYPAALQWFKLAIGHGGDAMVAHGLAHTLRKLGMSREAEEVAYAWREPLVNNSILFIDVLEEDLTRERPPVIEADRLSRYAQVTVATESGEGAQALAWYAYNSCQYPMALKWFERAVAWLPKEATVYGYALALQRLHRDADFRDVVNRYDGLFPKVVALAFDDGVRRPPQPCDLKGHPLPAQDGSIALGRPQGATGRTMADTLRPERLQARRAPAWDAEHIGSAIPSPEMTVAEGPQSLRKKTAFPTAVALENPLRYSDRAAAAVAPAARSDAPLVARRVPGVGEMPYERYGYTLLPGWNGVREPSSPTAAEQSAPAGTLWALEQSLRDDARSRSSSFGANGLARRPLVQANPDAVAQPDRRS